MTPTLPKQTDRLACLSPVRMLCCAAALAWSVASAPGAGLRPIYLRCEYLVNPLAVDIQQAHLSWIMESAERGQEAVAYRILVASNRDGLRRDLGDLWDSGKIPYGQAPAVIYGGKLITSRSDAFWKVQVWGKDGAVSTWSEPATWRTGLTEPADWMGKWIADPTELPPITQTKGPHEVERYDAQPATMLRKGFSLQNKPKRAILYASALGVYELRLNGKRVGDRILAPEWTDYHRRVQYQAYDVTQLLRPGDNVLAAFLGDGWFAGRLGLSDVFYTKLRGIYGRKPYLLTQLEIELPDGNKVIVVSDGSWLSTKSGPIRSSDLIDGEVYDARREMPGWDTIGFQARDWLPVEVMDRTPAKLVVQPNEPIRALKELSPVGVAEPKPGIFVFDLGQNMVGWCRLRVNGTAGTVVMLHYGEMLNSDGTIYRANLRGAPQEDRCILSGRDQVFQPHFTYHGFRYVEVTGLAEKPKPEDLVGCVFHSSSPEVGRFECSDPMLNRLWQNIHWTQWANLMSVPTDCPQRDERLGWMGDIQTFSQTAMFNMDLSCFFTKWLQDVRDAQADDGRFADFSPHPYGRNERYTGVPAWADAGVFVPWQAYVNYGDLRILNENFESARRWIEFVRSQNPDLVWRKNRGDDFNDWLNGDTLNQQGWPNKGGAVPNELFATAFFAHSTDLVSKMARALGRDEDARHYAALFGEIKAAFKRAFVRQDGLMLGDTQAGYALALNFDLLPEDMRPLAARHMVQGIHRYHDRMSTGIQSTHRMMLELTRWGYNDVAWQLLTSRTFPSWGYMMENGATTIWERWDGYVKGRGFQNPVMNSFNHWAFGAVGEWMFRNLGGINPDEQHPGYGHFVVRPRPVGTLTWANASYDSIRGRIVSTWKKEGDQFVLDVSVPVNSTATVYVPAESGSSVQEGGRPAQQASSVHFLRMEEGAAVFDMDSGNYRFTALKAN